MSHEGGSECECQQSNIFCVCIRFDEGTIHQRTELHMCSVSFTGMDYPEGILSTPADVDDASPHGPSFR